MGLLYFGCIKSRVVTQASQRPHSRRIVVPEGTMARFLRSKNSEHTAVNSEQNCCFLETNKRPTGLKKAWSSQADEFQFPRVTLESFFVVSERVCDNVCLVLPQESHPEAPPDGPQVHAVRGQHHRRPSDAQVPLRPRLVRKNQKQRLRVCVQVCEQPLAGAVTCRNKCDLNL